MSKYSSFVEKVQDRFTRGREQALGSPWLERLARFGYFAKGFVYLLVGALGIRAAFGAADKTLGMHGALQTLVRGPFGPIMLSVVGVGLVGYALWRFAQALVDPEGQGTDARGLIQRTTYAVSGLIFSNLAFESVELIVEWGNNPNLTAEDWTNLVLAWPLGRLLVGLAGGIVIGAGLHQFHESYNARFRRKFKLADMSEDARRWVIWIGRGGHAARGIVFTISGGFLIAAALRSNARMAGGISDTLLALAAQPFGPWLLGGVALGLLAYGLYAMAEARYRWIVAS